MIWLYLLIFILSCVLLYFSGEWVVEGLMRLTKFLGWKEFVVAFFVMAFAASLPNFFVGITSAIKGIPELSFGDIAGNNLVALTLAIGLASLFAGKGISAKSKAIQTTSVFVLTAAILPLALIWDGKLSRIDGMILISFFFFYCYWLFCKKERFCKIYQAQNESSIKSFKALILNFKKVFLGIILLIVAAQGIVASAQFFAITFNFPLLLIGILITGVGSALPEIYFAINTARRGQGWMILGDLMGAVIVPSTLVLGIVALICPIEIFDFSYFAVARIFLLIAAFFFFLFIRSDQHISRREAIFLTGIYIIFLIIEILIK
jgi:cation:H+ antiporter